MLYHRERVVDILVTLYDALYVDSVNHLRDMEANTGLETAQCQMIIDAVEALKRERRKLEPTEDDLLRIAERAECDRKEIEERCKWHKEFTAFLISKGLNIDDAGQVLGKVLERTQSAFQHGVRHASESHSGKAEMSEVWMRKELEVSDVY